MFWISVISAIGIALILVEKSEDWPISSFIPHIKNTLAVFHEKLPDMLECTICTAFWSALLTDLFLLVATGSYFLWPLTGFAAAGLVWVTYQLLNALEAKDVQQEELEESEENA
tara:strand:+ start:6693 stop:7034 length:342 start_codon:yes stop_codon:yes gene_type:complete